MRKYKILIVLSAVLVLAIALLTSFIRQKYVFPILMYHSVNPGAKKENRREVSSEAFERQMRFLKKLGYNVVPLGSLVSFIEEGKQVPARSVAITFDDGYRDVYTYAFPVLKKYNLPATLFVIINEIGRPAADRLSWDEVKEMQDSGLISFGSHCIGPEPLVNIKSEEELRRQIFLSKKILEERLGQEVLMFSYPEGLFNDQIRYLVREAGYLLAVATSPGRKFPNHDPLLLKRLRISASADNLFVFWLEASGIYTFIKERRHGK
jgi:peptidoglycan/xylan/chitin deacetylase (PgdA/CDA1 family)